MRSLKKYINKIFEKVTFTIVEKDNSEEVVVSVDNIEDYIGTAKYQSNKFYNVMPPGVVIGLAYSSHGGSILYIESSKSNNLKAGEVDSTSTAKTGSLKVTGQLGSVMQESS